MSTLLSPDTREAVRYATMSVCDTGGTMDELALVEQSDAISGLVMEIESIRAAAQVVVDAADSGISVGRIENAINGLSKALENK